MKCIILAAGYATRLYPLTENFPKPLLKVQGKCILDWLVDDIDASGVVDEYVVVTNHRFAAQFETWAASRSEEAAASPQAARRQTIKVVDDGTDSNETRLGAVKDIYFAIKSLGLDDDLLVIAGDNLLDFSLQKFVRYALDKGTSAIMRYYEADEARLHKSGVVQIAGEQVSDADQAAKGFCDSDADLVVGMEEKPAAPKSHWCCPPFYYFTREDAKLVGEGIAAGCGVDAPGSFVAWLCTQTSVCAMEMPGRRYDIGDLAGYEAVQQTYPGIKPYDFEGKTILVTGAAGFIGSNLALRLLRETRNIRVIGIDNLNDYYDVAIKQWRLREIEKVADGRFIFVKGNIADKAAVDALFSEYMPGIVVNLAAQAGVRYSISNPDAYIESNLVGFFNSLEACRHHPVEHLVYASSSSVYGSNKKVPYSTDDKVDNPVSLYAATKKSNELMAHAYSKLYDIPSTGLRFFTVYGPAGRPDMAYFSFTNKLIKGESIKIFNYGNCKRDFTYIDDIVEGVLRVMAKAPARATGEDGLPVPPYAIYNIGNNSPENLLDFVNILQEELIAAGVLPEDYDFDAHKELVPMQPGDVPVTYADTSALERDFGFKPSTSLREGLRRFARWYKEFYK